MDSILRKQKKVLFIATNGKVWMCTSI